MWCRTSENLIISHSVRLSSSPRDGGVKSLGRRDRGIDHYWGRKEKERGGEGEGYKQNDKEGGPLASHRVTLTSAGLLIGDETPPGGPTVALQLPPLHIFHEAMLLEDAAGTEAGLQQLQHSPLDVELLHDSGSLAHGAAAKERGDRQRKATVGKGTAEAETATRGSQLEQSRVAAGATLVVEDGLGSPENKTRTEDREREEVRMAFPGS